MIFQPSKITIDRQYNSCDCSYCLNKHMQSTFSVFPLSDQVINVQQLKQCFVVTPEAGVCCCFRCRREVSSGMSTKGKILAAVLLSEMFLILLHNHGPLLLYCEMVRRVCRWRRSHTRPQTKCQVENVGSEQMKSYIPFYLCRNRGAVIFLLYIQLLPTCNFFTTGRDARFRYQTCKVFWGCCRFGLIKINNSGVRKHLG